MKIVSSKRKLENSFVSSPKKKKSISELEILLMRFPQMCTGILKQLDNQSLTKLKQTSREFNQFIENDKTVWTRKIKRYIKGKKHKKYFFEWERAVCKTPVDIVRKLANGVKKYR